MNSSLKANQDVSYTRVENKTVKVKSFANYLFSISFLFFKSLQLVHLSVIAEGQRGLNGVHVFRQQRLQLKKMEKVTLKESVGEFYGQNKVTHSTALLVNFYVSCSSFLFSQSNLFCFLFLYCAVVDADLS